MWGRRGGPHEICWFSMLAGARKLTLVGEVKKFNLNNFGYDTLWGCPKVLTRKPPHVL